jgi:hypothetical protein
MKLTCGEGEQVHISLQSLVPVHAHQAQGGPAHYNSHYETKIQDKSAGLRTAQEALAHDDEIHVAVIVGGTPVHVVSNAEGVIKNAWEF